MYDRLWRLCASRNKKVWLMPSEGTHGPYSPCAHGATWPTYWIELLQPLGVQIVQGGILSHGSHDAYFPSAPSLTTPSQPPPWPHQTAPTLPWARRTISAPLQTEVEQQHRCGGSMWSALQLHCTKKKKKNRSTRAVCGCCWNTV